MNFRVALFGATNVGGTWYLNDPADTVANDFTVNGDTFLQSRGTASAGSASASRVFLGQTATQAITVGNNLVGLTAGTGANDAFAYSIAGADYVTTAASTGNTINNANSAVVNVPINTASVGTKGGSIAVTPTATANNFSVNGTAGNTAATFATSTVNVVEQRVVTTSNDSLNPVNLGTAFVGGTVSGGAGFATSGSDATKTRVTLANSAVANVEGISAGGGSGGLFDDAADTATRTLSGAFATPGNKAGTVGLGVTGEGLTGEGTYTDVSVAYTGTALAHSNGSFDGSSDQNSLSVSTGTIDTTAGYSGTITIHNLADAAGASLTGDLLYKDFQFVTGTNNGTMSMGSFTPIDGGQSVTFNYQFAPNVDGAFSTVYRFDVGDDFGIPGGIDNLGGLTFTISGLAASAVPEPLTAAGVILLATRVLGRRARVSL